MSGIRRFWWLVGVACLVAAPAAMAAEGAHDFIGSNNCKKCHIKEFKSWEQTAMAQAFESLKPGVKAEEKTSVGLDPEKDYTQDTTCVGCHVTGWGSASGFVSIDETPELAGVGCESCHGAGGTYTKEGYMTLKNKEYKRAEVVAVGLVEKVGEAQCVTCHNADSPFHDPAAPFDFAASVEKGTHEHFPLKYAH